MLNYFNFRSFKNVYFSEKTVDLFLETMCCGVIPIDKIGQFTKQPPVCLFLRLIQKDLSYLWGEDYLPTLSCVRIARF